MKPRYIGELPTQPVNAYELESFAAALPERCLICNAESIEVWGLTRFEHIECGTIDGEMLSFGLCAHCSRMGYRPEDIAQRASRSYREGQMCKGDIKQDIPKELREQNRWLAWKKVPQKLRDGSMRTGKVPIDPATGRMLPGWEKPSSWLSFDEAVRHLQSKRCDGIGYCLVDDPTYTAIDLDKAVDANGCPLPWADEIIGTFQSYTEYSPSRTGYRIFVRGKLPGITKLKKSLGGGAGVEIFGATGYVTMTSTIFQGQGVITDGIKGLTWLRDKYFADPEKQGRQNTTHQVVPVGTDTQIIAKALASRSGPKFRRLFIDGSLHEYGEDHSSADMALCLMLLYWTSGGDESVVDRLFRQSALYREKWDRSINAAGMTYGQSTIQRARTRFTK
jgi:primase-polymerase (primpol)-like protein